MSVQRACAIIETKPDQWYLLLAHQEHGELRPGEATAYGPFLTSEAAEAYLDDNFSNPGGFWLSPFDPHGDNYPILPYAELIQSAEKPGRFGPGSFSNYARFRPW